MANFELCERVNSLFPLLQIQNSDFDSGSPTMLRDFIVCALRELEINVDIVKSNVFEQSIYISSMVPTLNLFCTVGNTFHFDETEVQISDLLSPTPERMAAIVSRIVEFIELADENLSSFYDSCDKYYEASVELQEKMEHKDQIMEVFLSTSKEIQEVNEKKSLCMKEHVDFYPLTVESSTKLQTAKYQLQKIERVNNQAVAKRKDILMKIEALSSSISTWKCCNSSLEDCEDNIQFLTEQRNLALTENTKLLDLMNNKTAEDNYLVELRKFLIEPVSSVVTEVNDLTEKIEPVELGKEKMANLLVNVQDLKSAVAQLREDINSVIEKNQARNVNVAAKRSKRTDYLIQFDKELSMVKDKKEAIAVKVQEIEDKLQSSMDELNALRQEFLETQTSFINRGEVLLAFQSGEVNKIKSRARDRKNKIIFVVKKRTSQK